MRGAGSPTSGAAAKNADSGDDAQPQFLRQRERDVLRLAIELAHARRAPLAQARDHLAHEAFRRRCAGGDADAVAAIDPFAARCRRRRRSGAPARPASRRARAGGWNWSCWAIRPRAPDRTAGRACAPRPGGSASRSRCRRCAGPAIAGKRLRSASMIALRVVDRQRRLRDVGELLGIARLQRRRRHSSVLDQMDRAARWSRPTAPSCLRLPDGRRGRSAPRRGRRVPWRATSMCTLVTSGQVASNTRKPALRRLRRAPPATRRAR